MKLFCAGWHDTVGIEVVRKYLECVRLLRDYENSNQDPVYFAVSAVCEVFLLFLLKIVFICLLYTTH